MKDEYIVAYFPILLCGLFNLSIFKLQGIYLTIIKYKIKISIRFFKIYFTCLCKKNCKNVYKYFRINP